MGIYIRDMEKPKECWDCFNYDCDHWGEHGYDNSPDCPLIEIDDELFKKAESAYALQQIRCKDCLMHGVCRFEQGLGLDGYCSQAERRTDEGLTE